MAELGMFALTHYSRDKPLLLQFQGGEIDSSWRSCRDLTYGFSSRKTALSMARALGGRPVTADYSELYRTLQSRGYAAENSIVNYYAQAFYEVVPYFTEDNHTRVCRLVMSLAKPSCPKEIC